MLDLEKTESPEMQFQHWVEGLAARPAQARQQVTNDRFWQDVTKLARFYIDALARLDEKQSSYREGENT